MRIQGKLLQVNKQVAFDALYRTKLDHHIFQDQHLCKLVLLKEIYLG